MTDNLISGLKTDPLAGSTIKNSRFVILGWTKNKQMLPAGLDELAQEMGLNYFSWDYGSSGVLFLLNSHPDIAYTAEAVVVKVGHAHSESFEPLNAQDLLDQGLVNPNSVNHHAIHGKPALFYIDQRQPTFWVYQSMMTTSQIYYWQNSQSIICSDTLRHLAALVHPRELSQEGVLQHLLFRSFCSDVTCFKDVYKLRPAHLAKCSRGGWSIEQLQRVNDLIPKHRFNKITPEAVSYFEQRIDSLIESSIKQITNLEVNPKILLSGGVDSTLLSYLVKTKLEPHYQLQSTSFTIPVPSFAPEIEYAKYSINLLKTNHQFVDVSPIDYPHLLEHQIHLRAHPVCDEHDPCHLALAQYYAKQKTEYLFSGTAMDTLFGTSSAKRLRQVERFQKIPGAPFFLGGLGKLLEPVWHNKAHGLREIAHILHYLDDPLSFQSPYNYSGVADFPVIQKCFAPEIIRQAVEYRLDLFDTYANSEKFTERMHLMELRALHDDEIGLVATYNAYDLDFMTPFVDSDLVRCALTFEPEIRFFTNGQSKWLAKQLIEKRLGYQTTQLPKRDGGFSKELFEWMKDGVLRDMVHNMERPGYMSAADFRQIVEEPGWFTWNLLNLDLFQKRFLSTP